MAEEIKSYSDEEEKKISSFKISKMSRGYNWEIKIYNDDLDILKSKSIEMDEFARKQWGAYNENN